jgi:RNA polymerase sigma factor (sigma-70 family)
MEASALRAPAAIGVRRPGGVLLRLRSDEQLIALFRQGNEEAFRLIHDRYRQRLSAYARQMLGGSATDADDAMQDVFLRAYAALRADDRPITLRAWLYRVAHNRCIDHLRRPASQPTLELSEDARPLPATTGDPVVVAESREALRRLVIDVRALPEQQRSALLMREMEGLTYQELAGALDVTVPAVKSLLVRARMGLVESQQARDTPCAEIREDITLAHDRGVRMSGRARRHARECPGCAGYRSTLRAVTDGLGALSPSPGPWGFLAKLIGLGAGGSGAAGGAAAAGGAGAGAAGATGTIAAGAAATKLAAVVCCAAVLGGGAVEVAREKAVAPHANGPAATSPKASSAGAATAHAATPTLGMHHLPGVPAGGKATLRSRHAAAKPKHRKPPEPGITAIVPASVLLGHDPAAAATVDPDGGATAPPEDPLALVDGAGTTADGTTAGSGADATGDAAADGTTTGSGTEDATGTGTTTGTADGTTATSTGTGGTGTTSGTGITGSTATTTPAGTGTSSSGGGAGAPGTGSATAAPTAPR